MNQHQHHVINYLTEENHGLCERIGLGESGSAMTSVADSGRWRRN
jgi:hypothetical protein